MEALEVYASAHFAIAERRVTTVIFTKYWTSVREQLFSGIDGGTEQAAIGNEGTHPQISSANVLWLDNTSLSHQMS